MCGGPVSLCCYVIPHFYLVCASSLLFLFPSCIYSYSTTNIALRAIHEIGLVPRHVIWRTAAAKVLVSCPARARLPAVESGMCMQVQSVIDRGLRRDVTRTGHVDDKDKELEMAIAPGRLQVSRQVYLWLMAGMYLFAFSSLYSQIPGIPTSLFIISLIVTCRESGLRDYFILTFIAIPYLVAASQNSIPTLRSTSTTTGIGVLTIVLPISKLYWPT